MLDATTFELGTATYQVRPLFPALRSISERYGGIFGAVARVESYDVGAMAQIITDLLSANGNTLRVEVVGEQMMAKPLSFWVAPILEVLTNALGSGPEEPVSTGDTKSGGEDAAG